jgi:hypothetical protein
MNDVVLSNLAKVASGYFKLMMRKSHALDCCRNRSTEHSEGSDSLGEVEVPTATARADIGARHLGDCWE